MSAKLCFNCLNANHTVDACTSKGRCQVCLGKHHTRLHSDNSTRNSTSCKVANTDEVPSVSPAQTVANVVTQSTTACAAAVEKNVLMATACIILESPSGQRISVRALLDSGAQECFITEHVALLLGLNKIPANVVVSGVGGSITSVAKYRASMTLRSALDSTFSFEISALILTKLSTIIPRYDVKKQAWPHTQGLRLADPQFGTPTRIDCILSSEIYGRTLRLGLKHGPPGTPTAQQTVFGWVLLGTTTADPENSSTKAASCHTIAVDHELTKAVNRLWEIQEPVALTMLTPEEEACLHHFKSTHTRDETGRFVVRLPFVSKPPQSNTRRIAEACFSRLEKRFNRQPELAKQYKDFMIEYRELGHMEKVLRAEQNSSDVSYYPHHPVFKRDAPDKIRVVFNASQKNERGESFNSYLHVGPKLQEDILVLITRWSFMPIGFTCDVVKMYRQFRVHPADLDWQRILWRDSMEECLEAYRLRTVTYGTASAPFLANACMLQLAEDGEKEWPVGAALLKKSRYADDFLAGGDTLEEAVSAAKQLMDILSSAGMDVGKWASSNPELLKRLGVPNPNNRETELKQPEVVSTLGLQWIAEEDSFSFKIADQKVSKQITKRSILSETATLFDPIGWLEPVIIRAKVLLQDLWLQGIDWDAPVPARSITKWQEFQEQLKQLEDIRISRSSGATKKMKWELHGFADASERAYAAVVYIVIYTPGGVITRIIAAKSRVAPTKVISLPKLELCGAVLLANLTHYLLSKLDSQPEQIHCWSDSEVALAWLDAHPSRWKTFIANRVSEVKMLLSTAVWRHVRSADNPADLATRGMTPKQLQEATLWWQGPTWLSKQKTEWTSSNREFTTEQEIRKSTMANVFYTHVVKQWSPWIARFSSIDKIIRILAYIYRWRMNARLKAKDRRKTWLSAQELACGNKWLLRMIQGEAFALEIETLKKKSLLSSTSTLKKLSPFLDVEGLLRVGGRLQNASLSENEKHPIILPGYHHATQLLIEKMHKVRLLGGARLIQAQLSSQYWIIRGRNLIRSIARKCITCARHHAVTLEQKMGNLPAVRTRPARPFTFTGVDLCGPFQIKASPGRGQKSYKGYVALFICLVVRAVHIEVVSDLTTASFLAAFRRFTARRGLCKCIHSDNATNFQGADAELKRMFSETSAISQEIASIIARDGVEWTFIPPRAPNFGELWEANIKSFKRHLKKVIGEVKLTYEEFSTVATMIEGCLNSRPLAQCDSLEEDLPILTPGHFLIGAPMMAPPEDFTETNETETPASRWHLLTLIRNQFWLRWKKEFLLQLQQRSKWFNPNHEFKVGDIVLFKDDLTPPTHWPLARIIELRPGLDGLSRVAVIKTVTSEYVRPIKKMIVLPTNARATAHLALTRAAMAGGALEWFANPHEELCQHGYQEVNLNIADFKKKGDEE